MTEHAPARKIELKVGPIVNGDEQVLLDGQDITHHIQSLTVNAAAGEMSSVDLRLVNLDVLAEVGTEHITVVAPDEEDS